MFTCDQGHVFVMFRRWNIGWDVGQARLEKLRRDAADPARPSRNMRRQLGSKRHLARASNAYFSRTRSFEFCLPTKGTTG